MLLLLVVVVAILIKDHFGVGRCLVNTSTEEEKNVLIFFFSKQVQLIEELAEV